MAKGNTTVHVLVGAAITVVLSFIPFSPVLGGAVTGYLQRGQLSDGATVGGVAGLVALLPVVALVALVGAFVAVPLGMPAYAQLGLAFLFVLLALYVVALSAIGGAIGAYLATELRPADPASLDTGR